MKTKLLTALIASSAAMFSANAYAGMVVDAHGNVGYDTAAECDAAVHAGTAKFYQPFTHQSPLIRKGEKSVQAAKLRDLGAQYQNGACDIGVGRKLGRDGVSKKLQGKYVPYSPDMPVNVYADATGRAVRVSMKQCDNWFSDNAPRPVAPKPQPRVEAPKPVEVAKPVPAPTPVAPVVVAAAPVVAAKSSVKPYVFGSIGAVRDGFRATDTTPDNMSSKKVHDTAAAAQIGAGVQFNQYLGAEAYYQGGQKHQYKATVSGEQLRERNHTYGARITAGVPVAEKARVFAKAGVAGVHHKLNDGEKQSAVRPTVGVGASYSLTENVSLRADYDHVFKHRKKVKENCETQQQGSHYLGAGIQYNF